MTIWHPLVNPDQHGATAESNLQDMDIIRGLPSQVINPLWGGEDDIIHSQFIDNKERQAAINSMIEANIPLVLLKVTTYIGLNPVTNYLADDLVSEGVLALVAAVNSLANLDTPEANENNPNGYIGNRIIWGIARLAENEDKQKVTEDYNLRAKLEFDPSIMIDMLDFIMSACQTPEDITIIEMRMTGSTDEEVAARLDISRTAVRVQRHELMQRYDALMEAKK